MPCFGTQKETVWHKDQTTNHPTNSCRSGAEVPGPRAEHSTNVVACSRLLRMLSGRGPVKTNAMLTTIRPTRQVKRPKQPISTASFCFAASVNCNKPATFIGYLILTFRNNLSAKHETVGHLHGGHNRCDYCLAQVSISHRYNRSRNLRQKELLASGRTACCT